MKRKDWKIKKLKKITYDNYFDNTDIIFLRKLYLKKIKNLLKKNLKVNFIFYSFFINMFVLKKNKYIFNNFYKNLNKNKSVHIIPHFFIKEKSENISLFYDFANLKNYEFYFLNKSICNVYNKNLYPLKKGLLFNIQKSIFDKSNKSFYLDNYDVLEKELFFLKDFKPVLSQTFNSLSYNIFYNFQILQILEVYKIISILYLYCNYNL